MGSLHFWNTGPTPGASIPVPLHTAPTRDTAMARRALAEPHMKCSSQKYSAITSPPTASERPFWRQGQVRQPSELALLAHGPRSSWRRRRQQPIHSLHEQAPPTRRPQCDSLIHTQPLLFIFPTSSSQEPRSRTDRVVVKWLYQVGRSECKAKP